MNGIESEISIRGFPGEQFPTQYGTITFFDWCKLESQRIGKGTFVKQLGAFICLVRPANQAKEPVVV